VTRHYSYCLTIESLSCKLREAKFRDTTGRFKARSEFTENTDDENHRRKLSR
jgi:hypothetical protein